MAAGEMVGKRLAAFPGPMSVLVALFGFGRGPRGGTLADGWGDAGLVVPALAVAEPEPVELTVGVGLADAGLADAGLADAEGFGLAVGVADVAGAELVLGVGAADVDRVGLGVAVGVGGGDVEGVGLGVGVGGADVEGAGLSLVAGAGVDGDGLGVSEALEPVLVLAAAGEGEGEEATTLANAGSGALTDSPATRKPPVTRPATTARRYATDM